MGQVDQIPSHTGIVEIERENPELYECMDNFASILSHYTEEEYTPEDFTPQQVNQFSNLAENLEKRDDITLRIVNGLLDDWVEIIRSGDNPLLIINHIRTDTEAQLVFEIVDVGILIDHKGIFYVQGSQPFKTIDPVKVRIEDLFFVSDHISSISLEPIRKQV